MKPNDHGTQAGARMHYRRKEKPCESCRRAQAWASRQSQPPDPGRRASASQLARIRWLAIRSLGGLSPVEDVLTRCLTAVAASRVISFLLAVDSMTLPLERRIQLFRAGLEGRASLEMVGRDRAQRFRRVLPKVEP